MTRLHSFKEMIDEWSNKDHPEGKAERDEGTAATTMMD